MYSSGARVGHYTNTVGCVGRAGDKTTRAGRVGRRDRDHALMLGSTEGRYVSGDGDVTTTAYAAFTRSLTHKTLYQVQLTLATTSRWERSLDLSITLRGWRYNATVGRGVERLSGTADGHLDCLGRRGSARCG